MQLYTTSQLSICLPARLPTLLTGWPADHITQLPLSVMGRLLGAHDAIMALLPLVDSPPWVRTCADGKVRGQLQLSSHCKPCLHSKEGCKDF